MNIRHTRRDVRDGVGIVRDVTRGVDALGGLIGAIKGLDGTIDENEYRRDARGDRAHLRALQSRDRLDAFEGGRQGRDGDYERAPDASRRPVGQTYRNMAADADRNGAPTRGNPRNGDDFHAEPGQDRASVLATADFVHAFQDAARAAPGSDERIDALVRARSILENRDTHLMAQDGSIHFPTMDVPTGNNRGVFFVKRGNKDSREYDSVDAAMAQLTKTMQGNGVGTITEADLTAARTKASGNAVGAPAAAQETSFVPDSPEKTEFLKQAAAAFSLGEGKTNAQITSALENKFSSQPGVTADGQLSYEELALAGQVAKTSEAKTPETAAFKKATLDLIAQEGGREVNGKFVFPSQVADAGRTGEDRDGARGGAGVAGESDGRGDASRYEEARRAAAATTQAGTGNRATFNIPAAVAGEAHARPYDGKPQLQMTEEQVKAVQRAAMAAGGPLGEAIRQRHGDDGKPGQATYAFLEAKLAPQKPEEINFGDPAQLAAVMAKLNATPVADRGHVEGPPAVAAAAPPAPPAADAAGQSEPVLNAAAMQAKLDEWIASGAHVKFKPTPGDGKGNGGYAFEITLNGKTTTEKYQLEYNATGALSNAQFENPSTFGQLAAPAAVAAPAEKVAAGVAAVKELAGTDGILQASEVPVLRPVDATGKDLVGPEYMKESARGESLAASFTLNGGRSVSEADAATVFAAAEKAGITVEAGAKAAANELFAGITFAPATPVAAAPAPERTAALDAKPLATPEPLEPSSKGVPDARTPAQKEAARAGNVK